MKRANPCRGRYAGCTADPSGRGMCESCAAKHAAKTAAKRADRERKRLCRYCGEPAAIVNGAAIGTCALHREYYAERART